MNILKQSPAKTQAVKRVNPQSVAIELTDKAHAVVKAEAARRSISPERLTLVALLDYLGREGTRQSALAMPVITSFPWRLRQKIVEAAQSRGVSVNQFLILAAFSAIETETPPMSPDEVEAAIRHVFASVGYQRPPPSLSSPSRPAEAEACQ
jgi:hypothetical protein